MLKRCQFLGKVRTATAKLKNSRIGSYSFLENGIELIWGSQPFKPLTNVLLISILPEGRLVIVDSAGHNSK